MPEILSRRLSREAGRYLRKTRPPTTALYVPARRGRKAARVHRASAAGGVLAQLVRTLRAAARATRRTQGASPLPVRCPGNRGGAASSGRRQHLHAGLSRDPRSARRFRCDTETGELRESSHGQLLADWVEVFAPVVFQPFR